MTASAWGAHRSTLAGVAWTIALLVGIVTTVVATWQFVGSVQALIVAFAGIVLYPGFAGIIAARSRSPDAVAAVATLLPTLLFSTYVLLIISTPWGSSKRVIAFAIGACLLFAAWLFGTILAAADMARRGGRLRVASAMAIGVSGVVLLVLPLMVVAVLMSSSPNITGAA